MESEVIKLNELSTDRLVDIMSTNLRGYEYDVIIELCRRADRLNALEAERDQMLQKTQQLEAERDGLREAVKEYIEWHGSSCDDHVGDVYPDCPACQTDARLTQALGGGDE